MCATVSRFFAIDRQSLWYDELFSWCITRGDSLFDVVERVRYDVHPPGFYIPLYYIQKLFGDSEFSLRFLSALTVSLSVPLFFRLAKRLASEEVAWFATALFTVSWTPLVYAQEARSYGFVLILSIATSFLCFELACAGYKVGQRRLSRLLMCYVLLAAVFCYVHYFGCLLIFSQLLFLVLLGILRPQLLLLAGLSAGMITLLYLPWLAVAVKQMELHTNFWMQYAPLGEFLWQFVFFLFHVPDWFLFLLVIPGFVLGISGGLSKIITLRHQPTKEVLSSIFLLWWICVPIILADCFSASVKPLLTLRNLIIVLPAAYLLFVKGIIELPFYRFKRWWMASLLCGVTYFTFIEYDIYGSVRNQQNRGVVEVIQKKGAAWPVVVSANNGNDCRAKYYFEKLLPTRLPLHAVHSKEELEQFYTTLRESTQEHKYWVVGDTVVDEGARLKQWTIPNCAVDELFELEGVFLMLCSLRE